MQATAIAQPNIALIKYWGKRDVARNLPAVGSISITLRDLFTRMRVAFDAALDVDELTINGDPDTRMLPRLSACLDRVAGEQRYRARITSTCNFPIAAGLASSASSFAALTVAGASAAGKDLDIAELASLAGQASEEILQDSCPVEWVVIPMVGVLVLGCVGLLVLLFSSLPLAHAL